MAQFSVLWLKTCAIWHNNRSKTVFPLLHFSPNYTQQLYQKRPGGFRCQLGTLFLEAIVVDFAVQQCGVDSSSVFALLEHDTDNGLGAHVAVGGFVKDLAHAVLAQKTQLEDLVGDLGLVDQADTTDQCGLADAVLDMQKTLVDGHTTGGAGGIHTVTGTSKVEGEGQTVGQESTMRTDQRVSIDLCNDMKILIGDP